MEQPAMAPARREPDLSTYSGRVSQRIRELREKRKLTTEEVAEAVTAAGFAVTASNIRHWENGRIKPNLDAMPYLASVLRVRASQLFPDMEVTD